MKRPWRSGVTLIEMLVVIAVVAIISTLAVPAFSSWIDRSRLVGAAEVIAQDMLLAKSQAISSNSAVSLSFSPAASAGATWCYGLVVGTSACDCTTANSCALRVVNSTEFNGITLSSTTFNSNSFYFDTVRSTASAAGYVQLASSAGSGMRVQMNASGKATLCVSAGSFSGYAGC